MNNEQLFNFVDQHLIDLRKLPNDDPRWKKVHAGKVAKLAWCYVLPLVHWHELKPWQKETAKAYVLGLSLPKATLVGKSAALIHGIPLVVPPAEWEATLPSNSVPPRAKANVRYRRMDLRGKEAVVHGIRVSTLDRTAIDIARFYGFEEGLVAVDDVRARNVGQFWINETLGAMGRVKGVAAARRAVAESINCAESPWESYARALILAANYPELRWVKAQYVIENYRADLVINGWLVIEIDGNVKYRHEVEEVIRAEHRRQQAILNKGYIVLRFSPEQLSAPRLLPGDRGKAPGARAAVVKVQTWKCIHAGGRRPAPRQCFATTSVSVLPGLHFWLWALLGYWVSDGHGGCGRDGGGPPATRQSRI